MLDVPIELARLIPPAELDELVDAICRALGGELAIYDRAGRLLAGSDLPRPHQPLDHDGERVGAIASTGPNAAAALDLLATQLGLVIHHANARELAAATHEEAMRMTFAELTEHNQRLQRALARLEELDRLKSNFLATMSHELRTPLTSVIGYAEMMAEGLAGPITSEQHDYLVTILSKADQLLGMITAVLDVASLDSASPLALERSALSLAEVVAAEVATYVPQAAKRGISIQVDYRGECTVLADRKKMRQIVSSLVSNAVKFTSDHGSVTVAVRPGPLSPHEETSGSAIQLVVTDSGIGISRDQVAKIFEPFFQVDSSSTRAFGGTGLGLTLAKAYVEAHGGRIWVDTSPGQGSTFVASFPLHAQETKRKRASTLEEPV